MSAHISMSNDQAALIAAASQVSADGGRATLWVKARTLELAREYVVWLDQVDKATKTLDR